MSDFLQQLSQPFTPEASGADPRLSDDFQWIKNEIEKMTGTDYVAVQKRCQKILLTQAKDLRIAGYLLLASTYLQGISGFIEALQIYSVLIEKFWSSVHPQREAVKLTAIAWLNNPRLQAFLLQKENVNVEQAIQAKEDIAKLNTELQKNTGQTFTVFSTINAWLQEKTQATKKNAVPAPEKNPSPIAPVLDNKQAVEQSVPAIISYYQQQQAWLAASSFARAWRWSELNLPPQEDKITRLSPPRAAALTQLQHLLQGEVQALYLHCEALFLEPGGQFFLDLQYHAYHAAKAMAAIELADFIQHSTQLLIKRLPQLMQLQFADGMPFADASTQLWLQNVTEKNTAVKKSKTEVDDYEFYLREVKHKIKNNQFMDLLNLLTQKNVEDARQAFHKQYAIVKLCLEHKRLELALPLLEKLQQIIEQHQLVLWQPKIVLAIWQDWLWALTLQIKKSNEKNSFMERMQWLRQAICQLDVTQAALLKGYA